MIIITTTPDRARDANDASARKPETILGWIPIATRSRKCHDGQKLYWQPISGAPVGIEEARSLADAGTLLLASRYRPDLVELVVRPRTDVGVS
jgi:hypothetical protein